MLWLAEYTLSSQVRSCRSMESGGTLIAYATLLWVSLSDGSNRPAIKEKPSQEEDRQQVWQQCSSCQSVGVIVERGG